jgi:alkanesulfonate monooxygenase SsuD/methylene tetrahydromethanopterin reductase-like flavin-dependent oxidoreductase (luciferase family)
LKFCFFHLMPYADVAAEPKSWPVSNAAFDPQKGRDCYRAYIDSMVEAEDCGFDWIGCNEHHFSPYGLMANPNIIGGHLAYATSRARLAIMGNLVPLNNPIRIAEEYAMLDCMSGGRLIVGLIRGVPHEYLAYNIPPSESWERQREAIHLIIKAWTEPQPFGWEGEHFQFRQVSIWPKPLQQPHPPLVLSATTIESARFAAEMKATMGIPLLGDLATARDNIEVYKETAKSCGWTPTPDNVLIGMDTCIADTDEEAIHWLREGAGFYNKVLLGSFRNAQRLVLQETRYNETEAANERWQARLTTRAALSLEEQIDRGLLLCGSPETVVKQIKRISGELGNGVFNITMKVGNTPNEVVAKGMRLFRERVYPHVRDL